ncbi:dihydroorotase [Flavobacteriaceae bacterium F89]|uniref:Dihydroorotase n=1 Tax=Cerina litoralis TaxID=2874477 RepID=A0AAE3EYE3_9FLAO|nr:dihydroorotase [Cerina litoralis]MCG2462011.1 dihydroorotase [Cerina litoralis]
MNILIKSAKIIDPSNEELHSKKRDVLIKNGIIVAISPKIEEEKGTKVVQAKNLHLSNGWFDSGIAFGEPGFEERETIANGLLTAAKGGFTDIVLNPNTHPVPDTSSDIVFLRNRANGHACNLYPLGTLTMNGSGKDLAELYDMKNAGAVGFYDFKHPVENANLLKIGLQYTQNFGGLVFSFPLDTSIYHKGVANEGAISTKLGLRGIPAMAEELQVARDLFILEYTGGKLHIPTISTANSVKLIAEGKKKGLDVSCSVAIHNLFYTDNVLEEFDTRYKVLPPLRTKSDTKALIRAVKDGTIDFVTTDHTPMDVEQKRVEFDNAAYGTIGIENSFGILNQLFDLDTTISLLTNGRERFGLLSPELKEGKNACLTLFNSAEEYVFNDEHINSTSKNSMFLGSMLKGKALGIICNDQCII